MELQWGTLTWYLLHQLSFNMYPNVDYHNLLTLLGNSMPCEDCKSHFLTHLNKYPIHDIQQDDFIDYVINVHNLTNRYKKEPSPELSFDQVIDLYANEDNTDVPLNHKHITDLIELIHNSNPTNEEFIQFLYALVDAYPCEICQPSLKQFTATYNYQWLTNYKTSKLFTWFVNKYVNIINQHHVHFNCKPHCPHCSLNLNTHQNQNRDLNHSSKSHKSYKLKPPKTKVMVYPCEPIMLDECHNVKYVVPCKSQIVQHKIQRIISRNLEYQNKFTTIVKQYLC